jgi:hypothetical protein
MALGWSIGILLFFYFFSEFLGIDRTRKGNYARGRGRD